jgi:hypothetical protein
VEAVRSGIPQGVRETVEQAKLGPNLKAVKTLEAQPGVNEAVVVSAVAGMVFDEGLTTEEKIDVIVTLANASVAKVADWVTAVRNALAGLAKRLGIPEKVEIMDKPGLEIELVGMDADISAADLGTLANKMQQKAFALVVDGANVKAAETKRAEIMARLASILKTLDAEKRFDIVVINKNSPKAATALEVFANQKMGAMAPTADGQRNYVLMGDADLLGVFKDSVRAVMVREGYSGDVKRRVAASTLASIVSQRLLSASEIDAIKGVLNTQKEGGFYSFNQVALNEMLTIALQVAQAIQSAA